MHFMFFSAQYLPTVGGVERYTASLGRELVKNGHRVTVVTSSLPGLASEETGEDGIHIVRLPVLPLMGGRFPVLKLSKVAARFGKWFSDNRPDMCVIQTRFYTLSLFAAMLCSKNMVPNIVIDHSTSHLMSGGIVGFFADAYEHLAAWYISKRTNGFYGVSNRCNEWLRHFKIEPKGVIYNCVSLEVIENIPAASKKDYGCREDKVLVVFAARLIEEKGILKLLKAFDGFKDRAHLVVAGTGPLLEKVKEFECEAVTVTGSLPFEKVISLYKCADIFCLPTDYPEGFPTTVLEAAACNTMVVATDRGGTSEIICDDDHGIIIKNNTVEGLNEELKTAIDCEELRDKCAANSYDLLKDRFVWDKTAAQLEQICSGLVREEDNK